jgi:carbon storage regulator
MLIIGQRQTESISIGKDIILTVVKISGEKVRIGVQAPAHMKVLRAELESEECSIIPFPTQTASEPVSDIAKFRKAA